MVRKYIPFRNYYSTPNLRAEMIRSHTTLGLTGLVRPGQSHTIGSTVESPHGQEGLREIHDRFIDGPGGFDCNPVLLITAEDGYYEHTESSYLFAGIWYNPTASPQDPATTIFLKPEKCHTSLVKLHTLTGYETAGAGPGQRELLRFVEEELRPAAQTFLAAQVAMLKLSDWYQPRNPFLAEVRIGVEYVPEWPRTYNFGLSREVKEVLLEPLQLYIVNFVRRRYPGRFKWLPLQASSRESVLHMSWW